MNTLNFIVPKSWAQLDDNQLRYIYRLIASEFSLDEVKTLALLKFSGCRVLGRDNHGFIIKSGKRIFLVSAIKLAEVLPALDWLNSLPLTPVRLSSIRRHKPVPADFQEVPFETFIIVENLYQGFLSTKNDAMLDDIAHVLYPGLKASLSPEERISIFYWVAALKDMLARRFPDFFLPVSSGQENLLGAPPNIGVQLQESMDAQIRALTKGDITKEREILALDTWRALTELNAQAKDYKQLNAQANAKK